jgi:hypothetical protein
MANVAEVIFKGTDQTSPVAKRVAQNLKQTSQEMKGLGMAFSQASTIANQFGNTAIAGVIGQLDSAVMSMSNMTKEVAKSKAGFIALAAAVTAGGYAIGNSIRQYIPFFNEPDKLEAAAKTLREAGAVANQRLSLRDPKRAGQDAQQRSTQERIDEIKAGGGLTPEKEELILQLEQFKTEAAQKGIADRENLETEAGMKLALRQQEYGAQAIAIENEFAGQKIAVRMWESEQRRQIDDMELVTEEAKGEAKVELAKLTAAKINEVNKRSAAADAATLKNNQALMSNLRLDALRNLASLSGSLAQITKKNFALSKVFSYSQAIINTAVGVTEALKLPFPYNLAAAAATGAAGAVQISAIASQKAPQAHGGLDYVPQEATYKLSRGEMVLDPGTSDAVRNAAMGGGGGGSYQLNIDVGGESLARILLRMSRDGRLQIASKAIAS